MRRGVLALGAALAVALVPLAAEAADYYRVNVRRVGQDLYRETGSRYLIKTRYCYEYVYGEDAILIWEGSGAWSGSRLVFESGSECDVEGVYR